MYSNETIAKVMEKAREVGLKYRVMSTDAIKMAISKGNRKIGKVMNVSLMPGFTCGNCAGCIRYCYDIKACNQYPNTVIDARMRNTILLEKNRAEYFGRIEGAINRRRTNKYFRWHVAGDIVDIDYFDNMVKIARTHADFVFWTYTKMYHIVNAWIDENGIDAMPDNMHVMFSEWRGMPMINPYGMPEFRVVFKDDATKPNGFYCPGNCDACKGKGGKTACGCIAGENVYCNEH